MAVKEERRVSEGETMIGELHLSSSGKCSVFEFLLIC